MSVRRLRSSVALVAVAAAVGCATLPPAPREPITAEAREVIERLEARWREFRSLRTLADLTLRQGGSRQQARGVLLLMAPGSVRFEALSPMGQPLLLATVHRGRLTAYDATTNEGYVGPATAAMSARFLHLPFEPDDLVGMLAGRPIPPADVRAAQVMPPDAVGPSIEMYGATNRRRIWYDPGSGAVRQFELAGGRAEARVRYVPATNGEIGGFDLSASLNTVSAMVRYQNPVLGVSLEPDQFVFTIPKGAKTQEIR